MIRKMTLADIDAVVQIEQTLFNDNWDEKAFTYELTENPFSHYWVVEYDHNIIGYAGMWVTFDSAQITNIAILSEFQHQGWGQKLMNMILRKATENDCEFITLEVRVSNTNAISFYQKNGFINVNTKQGYYKNNNEDAYYMVKPLKKEV